MVRRRLGGEAERTGEGRSDAGGDSVGLGEEFLPGEVDDLEACLAQQPVSLEFGDRLVTAVVFQQAVRFGDRRETSPEEIDSRDDPAAATGDVDLQFGRRQS